MEKQELFNFIEECLLHARRFNDPRIAESFECQAFGALSLFCKCYWQIDPVAEKEVIEAWDDVYSRQFHELYYYKEN